MPTRREPAATPGAGPYRSLLNSLSSGFVEVEDGGVCQILRFGGIDENDLSWEPIRVWQVDVPVLDHGTIAGVGDGIEESPLDLMELGVSHAEALFHYPIISVYQAGQQRSIRGLGHGSDSVGGSGWWATTWPHQDGT